jgi:hypothetical protein
MSNKKRRVSTNLTFKTASQKAQSVSRPKKNAVSTEKKKSAILLRL